MNVLKDDISRFNERDAAGGSLGRLRGLDLMNMALNLADRANLYGVRHTPFYTPSVTVSPVSLEIAPDLEMSKDRR